jgi:hypothetical protein
MISFIKNLFSGILSFFIGLFGGKKSQENQLNATSSVEKLKEATTSSAEKLKEATAKTSSGISSSLTGLFNDKKPQDQPSTTSTQKPAAATAKNRKRSGYFMELEETEETQPVNDNKPAKVAEAKTSEPVATAKSAKAEPTKKPESAASAQAAKVELVQTAEGLKAEPAKRASSSPAASANGQNQTETTFAPKYLIPSASSKSRRRPGPSMNPFLDMARQVKTPG